MAELGLQAKQTQNMVMTPQLQQSIKMLQLATVDLAAYISQQLEENPFLENADSQVEIVEETKESTEINELETENVWSDDEVSPAVYDSESHIYSRVGKGASSSFTDNEQGIDQVSAGEKTLRENVIDQINIDIHEPVQRMIAVHLADMLDESGYITSDFEPLSKTLKCEYKQIGDVLAMVQKFYPAGIFARDLAECLALQLKERNRFDPAMEALLGNLDLFAKREFKELCRICGVDEEDLRDMCEEIKALNPKPGSIFSSEHVQIVQPDVYLKKGEKGNWQLELNNEVLPKVLVNRKYYSEIEAEIKDKDGRKFLSEQYNTANWLIKALDQRANTILKVATEIVVQQDEFFRKGIHYLRPLILSDIAQSIEMHESTVSRVINGKYIATAMGLYELKYFFSSSVASTSGGEDISSKKIKFIIKELIDNEKPSAILSDDKLASILKAKGIDVARRTVMKYREAMKIPSSVQRRREKRLGK